MPNWGEAMQQTYEFYRVDPVSWGLIEKLDCITGCTIDYDADKDTLGSATFDLTGDLEECYVRVYLVTIQNGTTERHILGTFLVEPPGFSYNGKVKTRSADGYTPLIELTERSPELGYTIVKGESVATFVNQICKQYMRGPFTKIDIDDTLTVDFVANTDDTWLTFLSDLLANVGYSIILDEECRVTFEKTLTPDKTPARYEFNDGNSSILYPDLDVDEDLYEIPNVVEVTYSYDDGYYFSRVKNEDVDSKTSIVNRGREIVKYDRSPSLATETPDQTLIDDYAKDLLESESTVTTTVTFTHGYVPVRVGDGVVLTYERAGLKNIKAKITSQSIDCSTGCSIETTAVYTTKYWEG